MRVALAPFLVMIATGAQRRWGHATGGRLTGLPLTSGPIVMVLMAERGSGFATQVAAGMLLGLISGCGFCLAYAAVARSRGWFASLSAGLGAFTAGTAVFSLVHVPVPVAAVLVAGSLLLMLRWWPKGERRRVTTPAWWDLPLRMACVTAVVLAITSLSGVLGPRMAGLVAPLQVIATIVALFTHRAEGGAAAAHFLRGVVQGSFAFAGFFLVLALALPVWGAVPTFLLACSVAVHIQVVIPTVVTRRRGAADGSGLAACVCTRRPSLPQAMLRLNEESAPSRLRPHT